MWRKRWVRVLILTPIILAGLIAVLVVAFTWENLSWKRTYAGMEPGMSLSQVEERFGGLNPKPRRMAVYEGGRFEHNCARHLFVQGPNQWQYVFYLDAKGRVEGKTKWWD